MNFKCQYQKSKCDNEADYRVWYFSCGGLYGYRCKIHLSEDILDSGKLNKDTVSQIEYLFKNEVHEVLKQNNIDPNFTFTSISKAAREMDPKEYKELFENDFTNG